MTICSWLNFGRPAPPGRGSAAGRKFLARPYYSQRAVFASHLSAFFILIMMVCDVLCRCHMLVLRLGVLLLAHMYVFITHQHVMHADRDIVLAIHFSPPLCPSNTNGHIVILFHGLVGASSGFLSSTAVTKLKGKPRSVGGGVKYTGLSRKWYKTGLKLLRNTNRKS